MAPYAGFSKVFKAGTVGGNAVLKVMLKVSAALKKELSKVNPATLEKIADALVRNAAINLGIGGLMEAAPYAFRGPLIRQ